MTCLVGTDSIGLRISVRDLKDNEDRFVHSTSGPTMRIGETGRDTVECAWSVHSVPVQAARALPRAHLVRRNTDPGWHDEGVVCATEVRPMLEACRPARRISW